VIPEPVPALVLAIVILPVEVIVPVEMVISVRLLLLPPLLALGMIAMEPADNVPLPTAKIVGLVPLVEVVPFIETAPVTLSEFVPLNVRVLPLEPALNVKDAIGLAGDTFRVIV
jgi:hypothetical protein